MNTITLPNPQHPHRLIASLLAILMVSLPFLGMFAFAAGIAFVAGPIGLQMVACIIGAYIQMKVTRKMFVFLSFASAILAVPFAFLWWYEADSPYELAAVAFLTAFMFMLGRLVSWQAMKMVKSVHTK